MRTKTLQTFVVIALSVLLVEAPESQAAAEEFATALRGALELHDASTDFAEQNSALHAFREVAERHPDEWLGHFWTAYEETQIARHVFRKLGEGEGPLSGYLDRAQAHLDRAKSLAVEAAARERSSFATLQSLIFRFRELMGNGEEQEQDVWSLKAQSALAEAVRLDPENPAVLIFAGTSLVRLNEEPTLSEILAAVNLMEMAQKDLGDISDRAMTTQFNSEWLPFWLPRAQETLQTLAATASPETE